MESYLSDNLFTTNKNTDLSLLLPLVSIIISNFNYEKYLFDAIYSVYSQNYNNIECIVVDDCSTDDSHKVIDQAVARWPNLRILKKSLNGGQSAAIIDGFSLAHGEFILFLDSDDILLPDCIASHVSVHMSSRKPVGFSCCDSFQIFNGEIQFSRNSNFSSSFINIPTDPSLMCNEILLDFSSCDIFLPEVSPDRVRYTPPMIDFWPWSTTSSMFFRRDALNIVCSSPGLRDLRIATDHYLAYTINMLTGSLLIDKQLVAYRIHGNNNCAKRPILHNMKGIEISGNYANKTRRVFLSDVIERYGYFFNSVGSNKKIFKICSHVDLPDTEVDLPRWKVGSRFANLLRIHKKELVPFIGDRTIRMWQFQAHILFWVKRIKSSLRRQFIWI